MKNTDLIVTRAGASTLSEVISLGIPSILIPSPYVPNNHQYKNALDLVEKQASIMLEEKYLNPETLVNAIDDLINDEERQKKMKYELDRLAIKDSSTTIYNEIKKIIKKV
jgi:UDP-N-acetylglucosamine--N-acetylmuramyl-(pentapeptide) pyrophosphoryl-undecaprenol N-acetylglucosamine transferase